MGFNEELIKAVKYNDEEKLTELIGKGADVNTQDPFGYTPLMFAAMIGNNQIVQKLISANSDISMKNYLGKTALMLAAEHKHPKVMLSMYKKKMKLVREKMNAALNFTMY